MSATGRAPVLKRPGWLGVIGGMGPLATADFLAKLALATPAACDQAHIPVLMVGDCGTPDRSAALAGDGPSPLPRLLAAVDFLAAEGVELIAMPCNSAHAWYGELAERSARPVLNIIDACIERIRCRQRSARRIGVLSTEGTACQGIYSRRLAAQGFEAIVPTAAEFSRWVTPGIARVKANAPAEAQALLQAGADALFARGAEVVILGCTEIPVALQDTTRALPDRYVDSTAALVAAVLSRLRAPVRSQVPPETEASTTARGPG